MNITIVGAGAMGNTVKKLIDEREHGGEDIHCLRMVEPLDGDVLELPFKDALEKDALELEQMRIIPEVIIDFSHPNNLKMIKEYAEKNGCGVVIATTGYQEEQHKAVQELSERVPVIVAANYSMGIEIMKEVILRIKEALGDEFDVEIVEKHHRRKIDAPSGTAKALAAIINGDGGKEYVYGRGWYEGNHRRRKEEIGIHAVRGGTIVGEHTVIFAGDDEIIEVTHKAESRQIFAAGAIRAAKYLKGKEAGLYTIRDVLIKR